MKHTRIYEKLSMGILQQRFSTRGRQLIICGRQHKDDVLRVRGKKYI